MGSSNDSLYEDRNATSQDFLETGNINLSFGLAGCLFNGFVCYIIIHYKSLRQPFNHLILNLAVSDFLLSLAVISNSIINYIAAAAFNHLDDIATIANITCKFIVFCAVSSFSSTCLTLFAISIERYQCITTKRRHTMKLSTTRKAVALTWLFASLSTIILAYHGKANQADYNCTFTKITKLWLVILFFTLSFITTILPILLMLILYTYIIFQLFKKIQDSELNPPIIMKAQKKYLRHSIIVIVTLSIFTCGTGLPLLLLYAIIIIGQYHDPNFKQHIFNKYYDWWVVASFLFQLTPIVNPLLYNFASRQFRKIVLKFFYLDRCCPSKLRSQKVMHLQLQCNQSVKACYM